MINKYDITEGEFTGQLVDKKRQGFGIMVYTNLDAPPLKDTKYEGEWLNDQKSGQAKEFYQNDKIRFDGFYKNDLRDGLGKAYFADGGVWYEGSWKSGQKHGEGVLYYPCSTLRYKGGFDSGFYSGKGELYHQTGQQNYIGELSEDNFHGEGIKYWKNGNKRYEGTYHKNMYHGYGTLYWKNGKISYQGNWNFHKKNKYGVLYDEKGLLQYKGNWKNDIKHGYGETYRKIFADFHRRNITDNYRGNEDTYVCEYKGFYVKGDKSGKGSVKYYNDKNSTNLRPEYIGEQKFNRFSVGNGTSFRENCKKKIEGVWPMVHGAFTGMWADGPEPTFYRIFGADGAILFVGNNRSNPDRHFNNVDDQFHNRRLLRCMRRR